MEPIIEYLKRNLKEVGSKRWAAIVAEINKTVGADDAVGEPLLRKIAYGDRDNPGVKTVQPLIDYFQAVERGDIELPNPEPAQQIV